MSIAEKTETGPQNDNGIYDMVIECSNLFETLTLFDNDVSNDVHSASTSHLQPGKSGIAKQTKIEQLRRSFDLHLQPSESDVAKRTKIEQLGRSFDLWIIYTGALASIERSLDNRLRDHFDIKEMVIDLLEMLHRNLSHIKSSDNGKPSTKQQDLDEEAWKAAEKSVDDLHFMAAAIHRASTQSQEYALSLRFGQNEEFYFENYATLLAKRDFPNARRSLCQHLGVSAAVRRQNIFRRNLHEEKFGKRREVAVLAPKPGLNEPHYIVKVPHNRIHPRTQPLLLPVLGNIPSGSRDSKSELQSAVARNYLKHASSLSTISSGPSIRIGTIGYPQKPKLSPGDKYCTCPYCSKPLDSDKLEEDTTYWESHVDADIQPYVCLSEDCTSPFLFFSSMSQWLSHMDKIHSEEWNRKIHMGTWYCDVDHGGQIYQFNDYVGFVAHMKDLKSHPNRKIPTESQIDSLSRRMQKMLTREDQNVCPLCDCVPAAIAPILKTNSHQDIRRLLGKHIAQHVKAFAFVTIPIFTNEDDEEKVSMITEGDEKWRRMTEGSNASNPSNLSDSRDGSIDDLDDASLFWKEDNILGNVDTYPETSETIWSEIGFDDYKHSHNSSIGENPDPILDHFSLIQLFNEDRLSSKGKIAMQNGTAEVRKALGAEAGKVTVTQIQEALWHYYFDTDKSVAHLTKAFIAPAPKRAPKKALKGFLESSDEENSEIESSKRHDSWLEISREFRNIISNLKDKFTEVDPIKIAIIDNGINATLSIFANKIQVGRSFHHAPGGGAFDDPRYTTSDTLNHGSLLATLICTMCPKVQLYICRVDVRASSTGASSIPTIPMETAVGAVAWAIGQTVDIICMGWTIKENANNIYTDTLEALLAIAHNQGIIMRSERQANEDMASSVWEMYSNRGVDDNW